MSTSSDRASQNASPNQSGGSTSQSRQPRNRQRRSHRETGAEVKNKDEGGSKRASKSQKQKNDPKDFRFLEVVKLVRKHLPITINGYSVNKILESHIMIQETDKTDGDKTETPKKPKTLSRKAKESILVDHIQNVIKRDPQQPIYLSFILKPADPDFPFELQTLNFSLTVPAEYPRNAKAFPSIVVLNSEIPRGFSINIERGFRAIVGLAKNNKSVPLEGEEIKLVDGKGLLSQVQTLNKYLEVFLQQEKRQTMKFVTFKNSPKASTLPTPSSTPTPVEEPQKKVDLAAAAFEDDQLNVTEATRLKREFYLGEMTQKLGENVKLFNRSKTEARYKVRVPIISVQNMPQLWIYGNRAIDIFVTVPNAYPETAVRVAVASNFSSNLLVAKKNALVTEGRDLIGLVEEARAAEKNFNRNVSHNSSTITGLVQLLNWISNRLNVLIRPEDEYKEWADQMNRLQGQ